MGKMMCLGAVDRLNAAEHHGVRRTLCGNGL